MNKYLKYPVIAGITSMLLLGCQKKKQPPAVPEVIEQPEPPAPTVNRVKIGDVYGEIRDDTLFVPATRKGMWWMSKDYLEGELGREIDLIEDSTLLKEYFGKAYKMNMENPGRYDSLDNMILYDLDQVPEGFIYRMPVYKAGKAGRTPEGVGTEVEPHHGNGVVEIGT